MSAPKVYLVGTGPGDAGLLTLKAQAVLAQAAVVLYDTMVHPTILAMTPPTAVCIAVGKKKGQHSVTQERINQLLVEHANATGIVVRLKGGDPFIFGRIGEEIACLLAHDIPFHVIPGVSAAVAMAGYLGIPLTHRQRARSVAFITGTQHTGAECHHIPAADTVVVFMGYLQLKQLVPQLLATGRFNKKTPIALLSCISRAHQENVITTLGACLAHKAIQALATPVLLVVGEVVALARDYAPHPMGRLSRQRVFIGRPREQGQAWVKQLQAQGADVTHVPLIQTVYNPNHGLTKTEITKAHWIVMTSATCVSHFFKALQGLTLDMRALATMRVVSLGRQTTVALAQRGIVADVEAATPSVEGVLAALPALLHNQTILYPTSQRASARLQRVCQDRGAQVHQRAVYHTIPIAYKTPHSVFSEKDVVVFSSPSMVAAFLAYTQGDRPPVLALCLGDQTAQAVRQAGFTRVVIAPAASCDGVCEALSRLNVAY